MPVSLTAEDSFFAAVDAARPLAGNVLMDSGFSRLLFSNEGRRYLATRGRWKNDPSEAAGKPRTGPPEVRALDKPVADHVIAGHAEYGGPGSFIVDMQGIDAFLFARAKYFRDEAARQAALTLGLVQPDTSYLRVGAAGAPPTADHPGGEVLEHSLLHGPALAGSSRTSSGHLPLGHEFSAAAPLHTDTSSGLLDLRSVYSHTAFLPKAADPARSGPPPGHLLRLDGVPGGLNALDAVTAYAQAHGIRCYAVRMFVSVADETDPPAIVGRVLRRLPRRRLRTVQEATDIASEQTFRLRPGQELHCFGTHYPRRSVDWEMLRGGKPYEPRGHIHMALRGVDADAQQHAVSHLRDLYVTPGTKCDVILTPVTEVVRVEPIVRRGNRLVSRCSGRTVIDEFDRISWRRLP
ncbi:hypothetical protein ACFYZN_19465 [Streptomyces sp. NPDC001777]|uniref:hypothetical protein n=1 Tax=Streptomyces sp. NPDC001777 TaxID=3364608 RepID=UPI0036BF0205